MSQIMQQYYGDKATPQARPLTPQEQNHVKMHKLLVEIKSSMGWEQLDPYTQDEISAVVREARPWFSK